MTAPLPQPGPSRLGWPCLVGLGLILLGGTLLRVHRIGVESFGIDELYSVHFATARGPWETAIRFGEVVHAPENIQSTSGAGPWWRVWTSMGYDTHPPLYPLVLRGWMGVFGDGDVATRSLSLVLGVMMILLVFDIVRHASGPAGGLWAAAIAAVAGPQIEYSQEVRSYMMLTTLAAATLALAMRVVVLGPSMQRIGLLAATALAAMLTHYWAIAYLLPVAAVLMIRLPGVWRRRLAIALAASAGVYLIAWGPFLFEQRANFNRNMGWIADNDPGLLPRTLRRAAMIPLRLLFTPYGSVVDDASSGSGFFWLIPLMLWVLPVLAVRNHEAGWLLIAGLVGPVAWVALADVLGQRQTLNLIRYTLPASAGLFALLPVALAGVRPGWLRHTLPAIALFGCVAALPVAWRTNKPQWRLLISAATDGLGPDDRIVVTSAADQPWVAGTLYMALGRYAGEIPSPVLVLQRPIDAASARLLPDAAQIVVIGEAPDPAVDALLGRYHATANTGWFVGTGGYIKLRAGAATTRPHMTAPPATTAPTTAPRAATAASPTATSPSD